MIIVTKQCGKVSSFSKQFKTPSYQLECKLLSESPDRSCSIQDKSKKTTGFPINTYRVGTDSTVAHARMP